MIMNFPFLKYIYPKELHLKMKHQGTYTTFLDLDIFINDGILYINTMEKEMRFSSSLFECHTCLMISLVL